MKLSFSGKWKGDMKKLQNDLPKRLTNVGRHLGRQVASKITHELVRRLKGSGWLKIYRDAIFYRETPDGGEWAIAGLSAQEHLFKYPARTSLAAFTSTGDGRWPAEYNPWPIDMIPAAYYKGTSIIVRSAPESVVEETRGARAANLPALLAVLEANKIVVKEDGLPTVDGETYADISYLARRLELGYPGFPRAPHWGPAASQAEANGETWLYKSEVLTLVEEAIMGAEPRQVPQMTPSEASDLAKLREATWP